MIINKKQFCQLASQGKVQVKCKLNRISGVYDFGFIQMTEYRGREDKVWCAIEDFAPYSKIETGYKVIIKPIKEGYKERDFYTSTLVDLINEGHIEMKIKL